jgi:hypothetical protein
MDTCKRQDKDAMKNSKGTGRPGPIFEINGVSEFQLASYLGINFFHGQQYYHYGKSKEGGILGEVQGRIIIFTHIYTYNFFYNFICQSLHIDGCQGL